MNYISNSLLAHQLERSLGPVHLWKQVQKMRNSVDFTTVGAQFKNLLVIELTPVQFRALSYLQATSAATYTVVLRVTFTSQPLERAR